MYLEALVFLLLLLIQLTFAFYGFITTINLKKRYTRPLGSLINVSEAIESIFQKENNFNVRVKVASNLHSIAVTRNNDLFVNKDDIYKNDLYTNYIVIKELYTIFNKNKFNSLTKISNLLFSIEILLVLFSFTLDNGSSTILTISIAIQIVLILLSLIHYLNLKELLNEVYILSSEILQLDNVEQARTLNLNRKIILSVFMYPLNIVNSFREFMV